MKKLLFIACLLTSTAAFAGTTPPAASTSAPAASSAPGQNAPNFADMKAKILDRISKHIEEAQKRQACVQAANDREALQACMPNRGKFGGRGGRFGQGGPGGQGGDNGGGPPEAQ